MSEVKKTEIRSPRKPLEPVCRGDSRFEEAMRCYQALLAEWQQLSSIRNGQIEGESVSIEKDQRVYSVREYEEMLELYRQRRAEYISRFEGCLETIEMVRAKIRKMSEKDGVDSEDDELPEPPPELADVPDEPWEQFQKRMDEFWVAMDDWMKRWQDWNENSTTGTKAILERFDEMSKFKELDYEFEMRLRHTYINPKTGEHLYKPNDEVGLGLICLGSRDYTPRMVD